MGEACPFTPTGCWALVAEEDKDLQLRNMCVMNSELLICGMDKSKISHSGHVHVLCTNSTVLRTTVVLDMSLFFRIQKIIYFIESEKGSISLVRPHAHLVVGKLFKLIMTAVLPRNIASKVKLSNLKFK